VAQKKKTNKDSGSGVDLLDKDKAKNKIQPPSKFKVIYHNDDYTPMELVIISLIMIYRLDNNTAANKMLEVHEKGRAIIQSGLSKEIAETKVNKTIQFFRGQGYPLLATFEKE
tara:strand:+ start:162 stop:500 length:339 start_codon:yes stop_codon:yes gene_type:complete